MDKKIVDFKRMIAESNNIVFFGGAGVSTESGIPDFRSKDGLYSQKYKYNPETILSHEFFIENPEEFYKFYKEKMNCVNVKPNITHYALAKLEEVGKLTCIVTQNIDGLHQKAGSKNVAELHGSIYKNYCMKCKKSFSAVEVFESKAVPKCECSGIIKPDVVLYGEGLKTNTCYNAIEAIKNADMLIVGGTSLAVYPACSYIDYFKGKNLVIINKDEVEYDCSPTLVIKSSLGDVFEEVIKDYE